MIEKLRAIIDRYEKNTRALHEELQKSPQNIEKITALSKENHELGTVHDVAQDFLKTTAEISENRALLGDKELGALAKDELKILENRLQILENELKILLIPKDPNDGKNVFLEIRAGSGGDEAGIFAGDLFRAYARYAELNGWKIEIMSTSESTMGGYKELVARILGADAYAKLKFESGTHRVQRVPETESQGRIHTSAVTIALMPENDDVEISINQSDLKIDVFRAGGNGGQCVNTTDSAVRITHLPTGISVSIQDEKSQHKNKEKAMKILKARILEEERLKTERENAKNRKNQIGSGDRSERIRTYNYPQNRITDHRINLTLYSLNELMLGNFEPLISALNAHAQSDALVQNTP